jgi:hypothetical protein
MHPLLCFHSLLRDNLGLPCPPKPIAWNRSNGVLFVDGGLLCVDASRPHKRRVFEFTGPVGPQTISKRRQVRLIAGGVGLAVAKPNPKQPFALGAPPNTCRTCEQVRIALRASELPLLSPKFASCAIGASLGKLAHWGCTNPSQDSPQPRSTNLAAGLKISASMTALTNRTKGRLP